MSSSICEMINNVLRSRGMRDTHSHTIHAKRNFRKNMATQAKEKEVLLDIRKTSIVIYDSALFKKNLTNAKKVLFGLIM